MCLLAPQLYEGSVEAGKALASLCPDLVILHSPHGITVKNHVAVYVNDSAEGTAEWNNCWKDYQVISHK